VSRNDGLETVATQPLFEEGGMTVPLRSERDPYELLDDLMVVVEQLCPVWPPRGPFSSTGSWTL
jgi:hypothetical protein